MMTKSESIDNGRKDLKRAGRLYVSGMLKIQLSKLYLS